jgi:hypothetical protein
LKLCANVPAPQEINETNLFCVRIGGGERKMAILLAGASDAASLFALV